MTGGGLAKKGVDHELFLTKKEGGGHPKILVQKGGFRRGLFCYSGGKFDM